MTDAKVIAASERGNRLKIRYADGSTRWVPKEKAADLGLRREGRGEVRQLELWN